jgi:hypothetical protein
MEIDLSVILPVMNEGENLRVLLPRMRVLLEPGGTLVIGAPDYATRAWRTIEPLYGVFKPGGYRDDHITHYTRGSLSELLERQGFVHEATAYILGAELIMRWRKPAAAAVNAAAPEPVVRLSAVEAHSAQVD